MKLVTSSFFVDLVELNLVVSGECLNQLLVHLYTI